MPISAHFDPVSAGSGKARASRRRLLFEATGMTRAVGEAAVTILNISTTGMLLETAAELGEAETIEVLLPEAGACSAQVVWSDGPFHGCRFEYPLAKSILAAVELGSAVVPLAAQGASDDEEAPEAFAVWLHRQRKQRGLSLAAVAADLGVSKPTVWAWEQGRARPTPEHLDALARSFGLQPSDLVDNTHQNRLRAVLAQARHQIAEALQVDPGKIRILLDL